MDRPLRIPIYRIVKVGGIGTVGLGRVVSGALTTRSDVLVFDRYSEAFSSEIFGRHIKVCK